MNQRDRETSDVSESNVLMGFKKVAYLVGV